MIFKNRNNAKSLESLDLFCEENRDTIQGLYGDYGEEAPVTPETLCAMITLYKEPFCHDLYNCTYDSETCPAQDEDSFTTYMDECCMSLQGSPAMDSTLQPRIMGIKRHHLMGIVIILLVAILIVVWRKEK